MIKVLIVDDSAVARQYLAYILGQDAEIAVVGQVASGEEALRFMEKDKPDLVTMDLVMPGMDGIATTRRIMETNPTPIVIVTANWSRGEVEKTFAAIEVGAVGIIEKPRGLGHPDAPRMIKETIATVKAMASVPVVRRWKRKEPGAASESISPAGLPKTVSQPAREYVSAPFIPRPAPLSPVTRIELVAVGASTGGPMAVQALLEQLPPSFPVPIVVVQHIATGFVEGMASWLQQTTPLKVVVASPGTVPMAGVVYLAPDGAHLEIGINGALSLSSDPPDSGLRPSVAHLFRSVATRLGSRAAGVLLTGMGRDGAQELKLMRDRGAVTFAQDSESSIVHGMPGEAIALGAASHVMPPAEIARALVRATLRT